MVLYISTGFRELSIVYLDQLNDVKGITPLNGQELPPKNLRETSLSEFKSSRQYLPTRALSRTSKQR